MTEIQNELHKFIQRLVLKDVRCISLNAQLVNTTGLTPTNAQFNFAETIDYGFEGNLFACRFSGEAKFVNDAEPVAQVAAQFVLIHELSDGPEPSREVIEAYAQHNGLFIVYPYLREAIHTTAARFGLGTLVLNVLTREIPANSAEERLVEI